MILCTGMLLRYCYALMKDSKDSLFLCFRTIQYNDLSNKIYTFSSDNVPREYRKKATLLLYFAQYMDEHLIHGGDILQHEDAQKNLPPPIFMKKWFRTGKAIVMYLNNGTLQVIALTTFNSHLEKFMIVVYL